ncbi:MAG: hypothetical protein HY619_04900 [Thaumarchaeota archaeon]|nr:hypothetical protein [Nitrososphaerota archaeon]
MEASAFSPAHITGFFSPYYATGDPLHSGSKGAGYSISKGVTTKVKVEPTKTSKVNVTINGHQQEHPQVSLEVAKQFLSRSKESYNLTIDHKVDVPIGAGLGSSAAAALGLALALNKAMDLHLPLNEAAQIAHRAEVTCGTGLGGVSAEYLGGFEVRTRPGAPGIGEATRLGSCKDYASVTLCLGGLSTRQVLSDQDMRRRLAEAGATLVDRFAQSPSVELFLKFSRQFAEATGLVSPVLKKVLGQTDSAGFVCSMAMIGKTVFTLARHGDVSGLVSIYNKHASREDQIMVADVEERGARLV